MCKHTGVRALHRFWRKLLPAFLGITGPLFVLLYGGSCTFQFGGQFPQFAFLIAQSATRLTHFGLYGLDVVLDGLYHFFVGLSLQGQQHCQQQTYQY